MGVFCINQDKFSQNLMDPNLHSCGRHGDLIVTCSALDSGTKFEGWPGSWWCSLMNKMVNSQSASLHLWRSGKLFWCNMTKRLARGKPAIDQRLFQGVYQTNTPSHCRLHELDNLLLCGPIPNAFISLTVYFNLV